MELNFNFINNQCMLPILLIILAVLSTICSCENETIKSSAENETQKIGEQNDPTPHFPTILISINVRNKAHYLPYFFGYLERLNYPKERLGIFIRIDHSVDNSSDVVEHWLNQWKQSFHYFDYISRDNDMGFPEEGIPTNWTSQRFEHMIHLRQEALDTARKLWADYLFMVDSDVMLINENILHDLIAPQKTLVGPLLNCTNSAVFANFWGDMLDSGYYKRSDDYFDIRFRHKQGTFEVPVIHTTLLINLNHKESDFLFFDTKDRNYTGPKDDIIIFAIAAKGAGLKFHLINDKFFGYFEAPDDDIKSLEDDRDCLVHLKMQAMLDHLGNLTLTPSEYLPVYSPVKSKLGFDEIYVINLDRRPDRKKMMDYCFDQLGIEVRYVSAVDGKTLNDTYLDQLGVKQLEGYYDPYHKRGLKYGEIGCFLSHYYIWKDIIEKQHEKILLFEDDIRFASGFIKLLQNNVHEANRVNPDWDLIYVGRKRMTKNEQFIKNSYSFVYPEYTYWTLSYIINAKGVHKLLQQDPLKKMVAVDEYLPIMFDKHPQEDWKKHFEPRNLIAMSMEPLLVEPTHYTGEPNYISDTEGTTVIPWTKSETCSP